LPAAGRIILATQGDCRLIDLHQTGERPGATIARRSCAGAKGISLIPNSEHLVSPPSCTFFYS
jgi:hypothetical protein